MTHSTTDTPDSPLTRLLLQAERAVLYTLGFHLDVAHPYTVSGMAGEGVRRGGRGAEGSGKSSMRQAARWDGANPRQTVCVRWLGKLRSFLLRERLRKQGADSVRRRGGVKPGSGMRVTWGLSWVVATA